MQKRQYTFYANEYKGRDAWCWQAYNYYLDLIAAGKTHDQPEMIAVRDADEDEKNDELGFEP